MSETNSTLTFFAGNYHKLSFTITDEDNGGALNLTGLTLKWAMTPGTIAKYSKTPKLEKTPTVTDAVGGLCEVVILSADTGGATGIGPASYYWELEATDGTGELTVLAVGQIDLKLNVENT